MGKILFVFILILSIGTCFGQEFPYQNADLPVEIRVNDLVERMTLEEKIHQMANLIYEPIMDGNVSTDSIVKIVGSYSYGAMNGSYENTTFEQLGDRHKAIQDYLANHTRLGIPTMMTSVGPHGVTAHGATIFPQMINIGSTWNRDLIEELASANALEHSLVGYVQEFGPSLDCAVDPRWGRVEECFGQDPFHVAEMALAYIKGRQGDLNDGAMLKEDKIHSIIKHMAGYSKPLTGINLAPASMSERELRSIFLYPFKRVIDSLNPMGVMPSYNAVNNIPLHDNPVMLRDILRGEMGFEGYIYADWGAVGMLYQTHKIATDAKDAAIKAVKAGVDLNGPFMLEYKFLEEAVKNGEIDEALIDESVSNVLRVKFRAGLFDGMRKYNKERMQELMHNQNHIDIALRAAEESCVLLTNKNKTLPLDEKKIRNIGVIGPNADQVQFGDCTYSHENKYGVTVLQGIKDYVGDKVNVHYTRGCGLTNLSKEGFGEALKVAKKSEVVIVVSGGTSPMFGGVGGKELAVGSRVPIGDAGTCGEGYDRAVLNIPGVQEDLIKEIYKLGKPVVLVLLNGRPYTIPWMKDNLDAILEAWYPGEEGGTAIANILFGKVNPSGKLVLDWPQTTGHIYCHYNYLPMARGYYKKPGSYENPGRDYVEHTPDALFPFGYGLSYTEFEYSDFSIKDSVSNKYGTLEVDVVVKNVGNREGKEVVQLYIHDEVASVTVPAKQLKGFEKILLKPGESKKVHFTVPAKELSLWDAQMNEVVEPGLFHVMIGKSSSEIELEGHFEVK